MSKAEGRCLCGSIPAVDLPLLGTRLTGLRCPACVDTLVEKTNAQTGRVNELEAELKHRVGVLVTALLAEARRVNELEAELKRARGLAARAEAVREAEWDDGPGGAAVLALRDRRRAEGRG